MLNVSNGNITNFAIASLKKNYFDKAGGGFFDYVGGRYGLKKLFYNAVCNIGLAEANERELFVRGIRFLLYLSFEYDGLVPSWVNTNEFTVQEQGDQKVTLGEQGLLLWALSKAYSLLKWGKLRERSKNTFNIICKLADGGLFYHFPHSKFYVPMTMAFILDGLLEYYLITEDERCEEKIKEIVTVLLKNSTPPVFYILRDGKISNHIYFNNLAYPIHALSRYALIFKEDEVIKRLDEIIDRLLLLQGNLGQWWWVYSPEGKVVQKYPVYSVHQYGMAIMALKMAKKVVDRSLFPRIDKAIIKSYSWIFGQNELKKMAVKYETGMIWRSIEQNKLRAWEKYTYKYLNRKMMFKIDNNCRSYELGWLLYARNMKEYFNA